VRSQVTGVGYFLLVSLAALLGAAAVAYWLANRFSRPLVNAVSTTQAIARGDLQTRMPATLDVTEFADLATAINGMADSLQRAQSQQRQFLLSVSHDLRTPLTSIRGYADAIADGATDDIDGAVAVIRAEAARLERLVQDLLDLARLDARRFSFDLAPVDVASAVDAVVGTFQPGRAAGPSLEVALPVPAPPPVLADPDRLGQILSNLVENATRYARTTITVGAQTERGQVVLWVADDGPGIAPDDLARVFEPHFTSERGSDRSTARRGGTGLGLAIVAELAAAMGGSVAAESPVPGGAPGAADVGGVGQGPGTRISVRLRLAPELPWPDDATAPPATATPAPAPGTPAEAPNPLNPSGGPPAPWPADRPR
jgi:two-component system sensor histidine kinase BaeS